MIVLLFNWKIFTSIVFIFRLQNGNIYCDVSIRNEMIETLSIKSLVEYISHNFVDLMLKGMYKDDK